MTITISEFAKERGVDRTAVNSWIRNHPEIDKVCKKKGKEKVIDTLSDEYRLLEKQYPLPKPVEVIEDKESRQKLIQAQELIIQMQEKLLDAQDKIAAAEASKMLLEDKEAQLKKAEDRLETLENAVSTAISEKQDVENRLAEAEKRIESLKNRGFWARLLNKTTDI